RSVWQRSRASSLFTPLCLVCATSFQLLLVIGEPVPEIIRVLEVAVILKNSLRPVMQDAGRNHHTAGVVLQVVRSDDVPVGMWSKPHAPEIFLRVGVYNQG